MAKVISFMFHPLIMPIIGVAIIFNSGTYVTIIDKNWMKLIYLIVTAFTLVLPLSLLPFFIYSRLITNIQMKDRRERVIPYFVTFIFFCIAYYLLKKLHVNYFISAYLFSASITILIVLVITYFWKISLHLVGIGGLTGLIMLLSVEYGVDLTYYLVLTLLVTGLLGTARLKLDAHTPLQIYTGFILGFAIIFLSGMFYF